MEAVAASQSDTRFVSMPSTICQLPFGHWLLPVGLDLSVPEPVKAIQILMFGNGVDTFVCSVGFARCVATVEECNVLRSSQDGVDFTLLTDENSSVSRQQ